MKVYSLPFSFQIGKSEDGLWYDSDRKEYDPKGYGIRFNSFAGYIYRPVPKFWKRGWLRGEKKYNPWDGRDFWFVLKFWFPFLPFLSIAIGPWGTYLGFKVYELGRDRYKNWVDPKLNVEGNKAICPSATMRRTRWK